jgi:nucleoside-diphosphate-sugar epimerase
MRILLTGATGQVGRAIALHLAARGHEVTGQSRRFSSVPGVAFHIEASLGSPDAVERINGAISPCEAIVHAAASLSHSLYDPAVSLVNCLGTQQIIQLADVWGARHLIYIASVPAIGRPRQHPITEEHPVDPPTAYHASKLYGEHLVRLAATKERRSVTLRLTSPAGPGTPENRFLAVVVRRALANRPIQLLGRGTRCQNYVDVRDVAVAVEACLKTAASGIYNIAGAEYISNYDLARQCIEELSSQATVEFAEKADPEEGIVWDVSIAKARQHFLYSPSFGIRDSIQAIAHEHLRPQ